MKCLKILDRVITALDCTWLQPMTAAPVLGNTIKYLADHCELIAYAHCGAIVTVHCLSISQHIALTAIWLKLFQMYITELHMSKFWMEMVSSYWVTRAQNETWYSKKLKGSHHIECASLENSQQDQVCKFISHGYFIFKKHTILHKCRN